MIPLEEQVCFHMKQDYSQYVFRQVYNISSKSDYGSYVMAGTIVGAGVYVLYKLSKIFIRRMKLNKYIKKNKEKLYNILLNYVKCKRFTESDTNKLYDELKYNSEYTTVNLSSIFSKYCRKQDIPVYTKDVLCCWKITKSDEIFTKNVYYGYMSMYVPITDNLYRTDESFQYSCNNLTNLEYTLFMDLNMPMRSDITLRSLFKFVNMLNVLGKDRYKLEYDIYNYNNHKYNELETYKPESLLNTLQSKLFIYYICIEEETPYPIVVSGSNITKEFILDYLENVTGIKMSSEYISVNFDLKDIARISHDCMYEKSKVLGVSLHILNYDKITYINNNRIECCDGDILSDVAILQKTYTKRIRILEKFKLMSDKYTNIMGKNSKELELLSSWKLQGPVYCIVKKDRLMMYLLKEDKYYSSNYYKDKYNMVSIFCDNLKDELCINNLSPYYCDIRMFSRGKIPSWKYVENVRKRWNNYSINFIGEQYSYKDATRRLLGTTNKTFINMSSRVNLFWRIVDTKKYSDFRSTREIFYTDFNSKIYSCSKFDSVELSDIEAMAIETGANYIATKIQAWWRGITERKICDIIKIQCPWLKWVKFRITYKGVETISTEYCPEYLVDEESNWSGTGFDIYRNRVIRTQSDCSILDIKNTVKLWFKHKVEISDNILDKELYVKIVPNYVTKVGFFSSSQEKISGLMLYRTPDMCATYVTNVKYVFNNEDDLYPDSICVGHVTDEIRNFRGSPKETENVNCKKLIYLRRLSKNKLIGKHVQQSSSLVENSWFRMSTNIKHRHRFIKKMDTIRNVLYTYKLKKDQLTDFYTRYCIRKTRMFDYKYKKTHMKKEVFKLLKNNNFGIVLSNRYTISTVVYPHIVRIYNMFTFIQNWKNVVTKKKIAGLHRKNTYKKLVYSKVCLWNSRLSMTKKLNNLQLKRMKTFLKYWKELSTYCVVDV